MGSAGFDASAMLPSQRRQPRKAAHEQGRYHHPRGDSGRRGDAVGPAGSRLCASSSRVVRSARRLRRRAAADVARKSEAAGQRHLLYRRNRRGGRGLRRLDDRKAGQRRNRRGVGHIRHFATHPALSAARCRAAAAGALPRRSAAARHPHDDEPVDPAGRGVLRRGRLSGGLGLIEVEMGPGVVLPAVEMRLELAESSDAVQAGLT